MSIKIINGYIHDKSQLIKKDILIIDGKIIDIADVINQRTEKTIDASGKLVFPGMVDVHVHLREPGFTEKETIKTGTMSAAKGGVTAVMAMPNTFPVPDNMETLNDLFAIIKKDAVVNVYPYASLTVGQKGQQLVDITALSSVVKGFSDDGIGVENIDILRQAIKQAKDNNKIIASHAEAAGYGDTPEAEIIAVEREIDIVREFGGSYHFCHLSVTKSLELVKKAQQEGLDITCEIAPHHLFLHEKDIKDANFKMNPPLRSRTDMLACQDAVLSGVCTIIATDHAPHTMQEKEREYHLAPNGIIGLETLFPLVYTHFVKTGRATLGDMENWLVVNPAKRFGIPYSQIEIGHSADLSIIDISNSHIYTKDEVLSKGKNSPFFGNELYGFNTMTLVAGKVVYQRSYNK